MTGNNTVKSTTDGTTFENTSANTAFDGGSITKTTVKGNTIETGKVTADHLDVNKNATVGGTLEVTGKTTLKDDLEVQKNTTMGGTLDVDGATTLKDTLDVKGDTTMEGNAEVKKNLTVDGTSDLKGDTTMEGNATVQKDLKVNGNAAVDKDLTVTGKSTLNGGAIINNGATITGGTKTDTLNVSGASTFSGPSTFNGASTFNQTATFNKGVNVTGGTTTDTLTVTGESTFQDKVTFEKGFKVNEPLEVPDGKISPDSKEAINGSQIYGMENGIEENRRAIQSNTRRINRVGAGAAALANLHPLEFDPSRKWNMAAAVGNYRNEAAAALGLFYRPNDDVQFNLSGTLGSGHDSMIGGGISFRLGHSGNKQYRVTGAEKRIKELENKVDVLQEQMSALLSVLNPDLSKDFPDVPENHWAYEAVSRLAGNDIIHGFNDGQYHGEQSMTRYQMAEIIYNALRKGAKAEQKLVEEFRPELQAMAAKKEG